MTSYTGRPAARDQDARDGREAYTVTWQAVRWPVAMPVARRPVPCGVRPLPEPLTIKSQFRVESVYRRNAGIARKVSGKSFQYVN